ncbi:MAG: SDR family NAD(P)-dependent oxidoreductase [Rhizobiaceae bacterium]
MTEGRFSGRRAVVTGGAAGIGAAISRRIATEGGRVMLWDIDQDAIDEMSDGMESISGIALDLVDPGAVEAGARKTKADLGGIDILICSAGITGPNMKTWEYDFDVWRKVYEVNVHGLFNANKACVPHMIEGNYGRIVNIASVAGKEGNPNASAYSSSKAAVIGLTKSLGKELAEYPITVNCVTPAAVKTAIFDQMSEEHIAFMLSKIPMGRFGTVDEVSALVTWLASDECSFSTGGVFDISGGRATY